MKLFLLFLCTCVLALCLHAQRSHAFPVQARVQQGLLTGNYDTRTGVQAYLGVPYAAPPVGKLRWRAPQPPASWTGTRSARDFAPRPVQQFLFDDMRFRSPGQSEDCLYLNVWTPARRNGPPLPVLLYFHGGGNVAGSGDELRYDGTPLARQGVVVVTINYRLNIFGFFAHPELSQETGYGASGNWGLLDQVAALQWVRANIAAFGGDPDRITIGGESAGSIDVSMHMASPLSRELFAGALGQSGAGIPPTFPPLPPVEVDAIGRAFQQSLGDMPDLAALRAAPTRAIYEAYYHGDRDYHFPAVLDGHFLTEPLAATFESGRQAQVPLMVGWTSAEMSWLAPPDSEGTHRAALLERFPDHFEAALQHYPPDDLTQSNINLQSDQWIVYSTWKWFDLHRHHGNQPVFRYRFDRIRPAEKARPRERKPPGAGHATDIEYFMGTLDYSDAYDWGPDDRATANKMVAYLANFIKTGNPNGGELPDWPAAQRADSSFVMHLDETPEARPVNDARFRFLDRVYSGQ